MPEQEVALVSPWVRDVPLDLPAPVRKRGNVLSDLLAYVQTERRQRLLLYCRACDANIQRILDKLPHPVEVHERPHMHTKAVVTPKLILSGSANLLYNSLYRNEENLRLDLNSRNNVRQALYRDLNLG